MGLVYFCETDGDPDHRVVVKRLRPELALRPGAARNFARECYLWLSLGEHPNIVPVWSVMVAQGEPPVVRAKFLPSSLRQHLAERRKLPAAELLRLGQDLVAGLAHARSTLPGFIHGDLKPENIMLAEDGTALIADFGLARSITSPLPTDSTEAELVDAVASAVPLAGTPLYMAPEQILGPAVAASDIYALGCVLHEAATGAPTYGEPHSISDYLLRHLYRAPAEIPSDLPTALTTLILACLRKDPERRPSLADLETELGVRPHRAGPPSAASRIRAASGLRNIGATEDAKAILTAVLADGVSGEDAQLARITLASCHIASHDPAAADEQLDQLDERALRGDILLTAYLYERGRAAVDSGAPDGLARATDYFTRAIELHPTSMFWANLATTRDRAGDRLGAIDALFNALQRSSSLAYYRQLVVWLMDTPIANISPWEVAAAAVEAHPHNPAAYATRALALVHALLANLDQVTESAVELLLMDYDVARKGQVDPAELEPLRQLITMLFQHVDHPLPPLGEDT